MPKIDLDTIAQTNVTGYPREHAAPVEGRWYRRLGPAGGLTMFGVSHVVLRPGAWSSQRHWHEGEDEFLVMLSGEAILVDNGGEKILRAGDCASFPMGDRNGHQLQNRSDAECVFIVASAGDRSAGGSYPDIDMEFTAEGYRHKDGTPYPGERTP